MTTSTHGMSIPRIIAWLLIGPVLLVLAYLLVVGVYGAVTGDTGLADAGAEWVTLALLVVLPALPVLAVVAVTFMVVRALGRPAEPRRERRGRTTKRGTPS